MSDLGTRYVAQVTMRRFDYAGDRDVEHVVAAAIGEGNTSDGDTGARMSEYVGAVVGCLALECVGGATGWLIDPTPTVALKTVVMIPAAWLGIVLGVATVRWLNK